MAYNLKHETEPHSIIYNHKFYTTSNAHPEK